jgi:hypothetical protein
MKVGILCPELFVTPDAKMMVLEDQEEIFSIPKQIRNGAAEQIMIKISKFGIANLEGVTIGQFLQNFFVAMSINYFIGTINVLQIITFQSLVNNVTPSNLEVCNI